MKGQGEKGIRNNRDRKRTYGPNEGTSTAENNTEEPQHNKRMEHITPLDNEPDETRTKTRHHTRY